MKKGLLLFVTMLFMATMFVNAQGGPRRTVAERITAIHEKFQTEFKLDATKQAQSDSVFANYYRATDKLREEMMNSGGDRSAMREKMQPLTDARDKELLPILGEANFKKFKDEIEPSMRRGGNGGNRGN